MQAGVSVINAKRKGARQCGYGACQGRTQIALDNRGNLFFIRSSELFSGILDTFPVRQQIW